MCVGLQKQRQRNNISAALFVVSLMWISDIADISTWPSLFLMWKYASPSFSGGKKQKSNYCTSGLQKSFINQPLLCIYTEWCIVFELVSEPPLKRAHLVLVESHGDLWDWFLYAVVCPQQGRVGNFKDPRQWVHSWKINCWMIQKNLKYNY